MSGLVDILVGSEDRGVQAVMMAMEKLGLVSYNRGDDTLYFREMYVSQEAFRLQVQRALRRHE